VKQIDLFKNGKKREPSPATIARKASKQAKARAKKQAAQLPSPASVTSITNDQGETFELSELRKPARVLVRAKIGSIIKVIAGGGFPTGPLKVTDRYDRGDALRFTVRTRSGKGKRHSILWYLPTRGAKGKVIHTHGWPQAYYRNNVADVRHAEFYDPELEQKGYSGVAPGRKGWSSASDSVRLEYFRDALYRLGLKPKVADTTKIRTRLLLEVERPLEAAYVLQALGAYGPVPKVRRPQVGDIFHAPPGDFHRWFLLVGFDEAYGKKAVQGVFQQLGSFAGRWTRDRSSGRERRQVQPDTAIEIGRPFKKPFLYQWNETRLQPHIRPFRHRMSGNARLWDEVNRWQYAST
jgi:hypothetical protein